MKTENLILVVFLLFGILFFFGSFLNHSEILLGASLFLFPTLLLYYWLSAKEIFWPVVAVLLCFFIRDIFLFIDFSVYSNVVITAFFAGILIFYLMAITGYRKARAYGVEIISLVIMYGFLGFLFYSVSETVPQVIPAYRIATYLYLLFLVGLLGISFTAYILKSNWASLWLMVASASLLISEFSMFFKLYILRDLSVNIFFPVFHVFTFYCLVQYGLHRRKEGKLIFF